MAKDFLIHSGFIKEARISKKVLKEWENVKIIKTAGSTGDNIPFYNPQAVERVNNIKKFLDMGYAIDDIQQILKKVGLPGSSGGPEKSNKRKSRGKK